jgi:hypothetical protein
VAAFAAFNIDMSCVPLPAGIHDPQLLSITQQRPNVRARRPTRGPRNLPSRGSHARKPQRVSAHSAQDYHQPPSGSPRKAVYVPSDRIRPPEPTSLVPLADGQSLVKV